METGPARGGRGLPTTNDAVSHHTSGSSPLGGCSGQAGKESRVGVFLQPHAQRRKGWNGGPRSPVMSRVQLGDAESHLGASESNTVTAAPPPWPESHHRCLYTPWNRHKRSIRLPQGPMRTNSRTQPNAAGHGGGAAVCPSRRIFCSLGDPPGRVC